MTSAKREGPREGEGKRASLSSFRLPFLPCAPYVRERERRLGTRQALCCVAIGCVLCRPVVLHCVALCCNLLCVVWSGCVVLRCVVLLSCIVSVLF